MPEPGQDGGPSHPPAQPAAAPAPTSARDRDEPIHDDWPLSPSSWNRWLACPRRFWLSRQRLPQRPSMASSVGTAVHAALEALLLDELEGPAEEDWLPGRARSALSLAWSAEKAAFHAQVRHPGWKERKMGDARVLLEGLIRLLLMRTRIVAQRLAAVRFEHWRHVQRLVRGVEQELSDEGGRLAGRLDLLLAEQVGDEERLLVVDWKTGRLPSGGLSADVSRQLRMYRDLASLHHDAPLEAEAWYAAGPMIQPAEGERVLGEARLAREAMRLSATPMEATPSADTCRWCEFKPWCPAWLDPRAKAQQHGGRFVELPARVLAWDEIAGMARLAPQRLVHEDGRTEDTGEEVGAVLDGRAAERLRDVLASDTEAVVYLSGARHDRHHLMLGDWCDVVAYEPLHTGRPTA